MYAVEFDTVSKDGVIFIPQKFKQELDNRDNIRLVVMYDDQLEKNKGIKKNHQKADTLNAIFDKYNIDFSNFIFDRDEANER